MCTKKKKNINTNCKKKKKLIEFTDMSLVPTNLPNHAEITLGRDKQTISQTTHVLRKGSIKIQRHDLARLYCIII